MARKNLGTPNNPLTNKDFPAMQEAITLFPENINSVKQKEQRIRELRSEASRLAALANKRVQRLEDNNLTETPAYKTYLESGGKKFGVKGKDYNEVQKELAKLRKFIDAKTSTVRGANNVLKEIAENTGIKYKNLKELREKSGKFFELASKVEQYLRTVEDMASAIGYQQIWEAITTYTDEAKINLADGNLSVDDMVQRITDALTQYENPAPLFKGAGWYSLKDDDIDNNIV